MNEITTPRTVPFTVRLRAGYNYWYVVCGDELRTAVVSRPGAVEWTWGWDPPEDTEVLLRGLTEDTPDSLPLSRTRSGDWKLGHHTYKHDRACTPWLSHYLAPLVESCGTLHLELEDVTPAEGVELSVDN